MNAVYNLNLPELNFIKKGKVRDVFEVDDKLLIVASDRISAFDVVMTEPISGKGEVLSKISVFWFEKTKNIVPNHLITNNVEDYPSVCSQYKEVLQGRSMLVKKCNPLPIECIVRGYITGSGWMEYKEHGTVNGMKLPEGLVEFQKLPEPIFTPSTKAEEGHDENISFEKAVEILGSDIANRVKEISIELYKFGAKHLEDNNLILADTKFEFGIDEIGDLLLIDEALTPDSSRFWRKDTYREGIQPEQFDKQILRNYLLSLVWDKKPPAPKLTQEIIDLTSQKYKEALNLIVK